MPLDVDLNKSPSDEFANYPTNVLNSTGLEEYYKLRTARKTRAAKRKSGWNPAGYLLDNLQEGSNRRRKKEFLPDLNMACLGVIQFAERENLKRKVLKSNADMDASAKASARMKGEGKVYGVGNDWKYHLLSSSSSSGDPEEYGLYSSDYGYVANPEGPQETQ